MRACLYLREEPRGGQSGGGGRKSASASSGLGLLSVLWDDCAGGFMAV